MWGHPGDLLKVPPVHETAALAAVQQEVSQCAGPRQSKNARLL